VPFVAIDPRILKRRKMFAKVCHHGKLLLILFPVTIS